MQPFARKLEVEARYEFGIVRLIDVAISAERLPKYLPHRPRHAAFACLRPWDRFNLDAIDQLVTVSNHDQGRLVSRLIDWHSLKMQLSNGSCTDLGCTI